VSTRGHSSQGHGDAWISRYPELVSQWHTVKNAELKPGDVSYGSGRKVWWKCSKGPDHEWQASPNNRTAGRGCPFCAGRMPSVTNNLAHLHPALAAQWHPTKNGTTTPDQIVAGSARRAWWQCPQSRAHEWQAAPHDRIAGKGGCPFCLGLSVRPGASLEGRSPELAAEWHPSKNGRLTPREVTPTSTRVVWWRCARDAAHEWRASVFQRTSGSGCPECGRSEALLTRAYVLCVSSDRDRRLALILFLRSLDVDVLGARDAVEAERHAETYGLPRAIVAVESERVTAKIIGGVPSVVVPADALRAWLAEPAGGAEPVPPSLRNLERLVRRQIRRPRR
jgi:Probable Zinc-ribbon domain